ncbi:MAG: hypothetical protein JXB39_13625 [Deltaproteobacteria bacterium]|nr:hypothetical protein [Deltaproteobacteria bacterium]
MRPCAFGLVLLAACTGETHFQNADPDDVQQEGDAQAGITPLELEFPDLEIAVAKSRLIQVVSMGETDLVVQEIRVIDSAGGVFYCAEEEDVLLAPGVEREFSVVATLYEEGLVEGTLRLKTNDPDALSVNIPLQAWTEGYEPSDTGPDDSAS